MLHVEPDLWAYLQQRAVRRRRDDRSREGRLRPDSRMWPGWPDNVAGFAQAIVRLRDRYAPNVLLGYHFSTWGTGTDIVLRRSTRRDRRRLGDTYRRGSSSRCGARFDIAFTDLADRDAAFKQYQYGDGGASWYDADDYRRSTVYIGAFARTARLRVVLWQVPMGNTKMRAENNTWEHYQDNKVEWLLDDPSGAHLNAYVEAGVVAVLFGRGADGPTCACDAAGDGVTNPAPINGNNELSLNADDDGGFFDAASRARTQPSARYPLPK